VFRRVFKAVLFARYPCIVNVVQQWRCCLKLHYITSLPILTLTSRTLILAFVRSGTDLILLLILFLLGRPCFKKSQGSVVSKQIGMKFDRIVLHVNMHRLTESDF